MAEEVKIIEDVLPEDDFVFEYSFEKEPYDYDSIDWYEEAVDAYLDANYEKAKVAAMLADFRLELEEEMEDEEEDEDEEESEDEEEESEEDEESEGEGDEESEEEESSKAEESEGEIEEIEEIEESVELEEILVATGEELIKTILKNNDLTQTALAEMAGVSRSTVSTNLNNGVNAIQLDDFVAYLDALGYEILVLPRDPEEASTAAYVLTPEVAVKEEAAEE